MKNFVPKIVSSFILVAFASAILCAVGFCPSMMKMANANESMHQQSADANAKNTSCCPSNPSKSESKGCCKCLDLSSLLNLDKNQTVAVPPDFSKTFSYFVSLSGQVAYIPYLKIFNHSPPQIVLNSTPLYILNRSLRL
jgi:hypothetical protein